MDNKWIAELANDIETKHGKSNTLTKRIRSDLFNFNFPVWKSNRNSRSLL